ncbi:MAG TPA: hypothetical protein VGM88_22500 [Kofleriaceae bacterium]|jgi:hypothetical protein
MRAVYVGLVIVAACNSRQCSLAGGEAAPDGDTDAYTVGGTVHGLAGGTVTLVNANAEPIAIGADGAFTFPTAWPTGTYYGVTVQALPSGPPESCTVTAGEGVVAHANVTSVDVECTVAAPWAHVVVANGRTCGIHVDGSLFCWGNGVGIPVEVAPGTAWRTVSLNAGVSYGIRTDGTLWRWDWTGMQPVDIAHTYRSVGTAWEEVCAVRDDGTLWCNGALYGGGLDPTQPLVQMGTDTTWASIVGSWDTMLGIHADGSLWWWGTNLFIAITGDEYQTPSPLVTGGAAWASVELGQQHACGVRVDGTLWCWGASDIGAAGEGSTSPLQVGTDTDWVQVASGSGITCGRKADHSLWCFGDNQYLGATPFPTPGVTLTPTQIGAAWTDVSATDYGQTCGTHDDGSMECWGPNSAGQLGNHAVDGGPTRVRSTQTFRQVAHGVTEACAIASDGSLWCADQNANPYSGVLAPVAPGMTWQRITDGSYVSAIRSDGTAWRAQNVGDGTIEVVQLASGAWREVDLNWTQSCGLMADGTRWCWPSPEDVEPGPAPVTPVQADAQTWIAFAGRCGIRTDGTLWCDQPIGTDTYVALAMLDDRAFALRTDGEIVCLGAYCGDLAPGATATTPAVLVEPGPWQALTTGYRGACGLKASGELWCWDADVDETLLPNSLLPAQLGTSASWTALTSATGAIQSDGSAWFWGSAFGEGNGDGDGYVPTRTAL